MAAAASVLIFSGTNSCLRAQETPLPPPLQFPGSPLPIPLPTPSGAEAGDVLLQMQAYFYQLQGPSDRLDHLPADALSDGYREVLRKRSSTAAAMEPIRAAIQSGFGYYKITSTYGFQIEKNVAFVQVEVKYDPAALPVLRAEASKVSIGRHFNKPAWDKAGGPSSARQVEENGMGLATYTFVVQRSAWRLQAAYFSLKPFPDRLLSAAVPFLQKEVVSSPMPAVATTAQPTPLPEQTAQENAASVKEVRATFTALMGPSHRLDQLTADTLSERYKAVLETLNAEDDPSRTVTAAAQADVDDYTVENIDYVLAYTNYAFVQARIRYDEAALPKLHQKEKFLEGEANEETTWASFGGSSWGGPLEKNGLGSAGFYFVRQRGAWKLQFIHYSAEPFAECGYDYVDAYLEEPAKASVRAADQSEYAVLPSRKIDALSRVVDPPAWQVYAQPARRQFLALNFGVMNNECEETVADEAQARTPLRFASQKEFVAAILQPKVQVLGSGENESSYYALCRLQSNLCVYASFSRGGNELGTGFILTGADGRKLFDSVRGSKALGETTLFTCARLYGNHTMTKEVGGSVVRLPSGYSGPLTVETVTIDREGRATSTSITVDWK